MAPAAWPYDPLLWASAARALRSGGKGSIRSEGGKGGEGIVVRKRKGCRWIGLHRFYQLKDVRGPINILVQKNNVNGCNGPKREVPEPILKLQHINCFNIGLVFMDPSLPRPLAHIHTK